MKGVPSFRTALVFLVSSGFLHGEDRDTGLEERIRREFPTVARKLAAGVELEPSSLAMGETEIRGFQPRLDVDAPPGMNDVERKAWLKWVERGRDHAFLPFFPERYGDPFAISGFGVEVLVLPGNAAPSPAGVSKGTVSYRDAYPETDVLYTVGSNRSEKFLLLRSPGAPLRFDYELRVEGAREIRERDGCIDFESDEGKGLTIERPWLVDGAGVASVSAVRWEISEVGDSADKTALGLSLVIDATGLAYPILVDPTWIPAGELFFPMQGHTATRMNDGRVLLMGGFDGSFYANVAELYDPATETWTFPANFPSRGRTGHTATLLNDGRVLIAGGRDGSGLLFEFEVFDPSVEAWALGFLSFRREFPSATLQPDGNVLLVGGFDGTSYVSDTEIIDTTFLFAFPGPTPSLGGRAKHSATLLADGRLLIAGGEDGSGPLNTSETLDFGSGFWNPTAGSLGTARVRHSALRLPDGRVLVVGGSDGSSALADAELFDRTTETWSATDPLSVARERHDAVSLSDGRVLVVGGADGTDYLGSAELFDPATETWTLESSPNFPRAEHTATLLADGRVLVAGGVDDSGWVLPAEIFAPDDDTKGSWLATASMGATRFSHTATLMQDGRVLVAGGEPGSRSTAEAYDPSRGTWSPTGGLVDGRSAHSTTVLRNGRVLIAGGAQGGNSIATCELFDPAAGTFTSTGALASARRLHTANLLEDGRVLVAGGIGSSGTLTDAEIYDPATESWSTTGSFNGPRHSHTATLLANGKVLVSGGFDASALASSEIFDPVGGAWTAAMSLGQARRDHSATRLADGRVLVVGGSGGPTASITAEIYVPGSDTWSGVPGGLATPRVSHTATLLPSGSVLISGGATAGTVVEVFDPAPGVFRAVADLVPARSEHTATLLPDGDLLVAGGVAGSPLQSASLYRMPGARWFDAAGMSGARASASATLLPDGRLLVAGGWDGTGAVATSEIYDSSSDSWTASGSMVNGRYAHAAVALLDGSVLVAGGLSGSVAQKAEIFEPGTGSWRSVGNLNETRRNHSMTLLGNGKVLVAGGDTTSSAEIYDPIQETWSYTSPMPSIRRSHSATLLPDGRVLVAGGFDASVGLKTALLFDPATETWSPTGSMISSRVYHSATFLPNGKVLVVGWDSSAELYDPTTGLWSAAPSPRSPRFGRHGVVLLPSGKVLLAGGANVNEQTVFAEIYDPATNSWRSTDSFKTGRAEHTMSLLPDGRVLAAGAEFWTGSQWIALSSVEIYEPGLDFAPSWRPQVSSATDPLVEGSPLSVAGAGFQGVSSASGGNGARDSATDYPLLQLRRLDSEHSRFVPLDPALGWSDGSFDSIALTGLEAGPALVTVFTNAIPSVSRVVRVECAPPVITSPPDPQFACQWGSVVFTAAAAGEGLSFRWRRNGIPLSDGGHFNGTATDTLSVAPIDFADVGSYDVVVSSTCSSTQVVSAPAALDLNQPPPTFGGLAMLSSQTGPCRMRLDWGAAASGCPTTPGIFYNLYRATSPGFIPGPAYLIASCVSDLFYEDSSGLSNGETYYYVVRAEDSGTGFGGPCNGGQQDFNLASQSALSVCASTANPPQPVPLFTVRSGDEENVLEWLNPVNGGYGSTKILYRTDVYPTDANDPLATEVDDRAGTPGVHDSVAHTLLSNGTRYYYAAFVDDGTGVFSAATLVSGMPFDTSGPVKWSYTTGATALAPPGIGSAVHTPSNDNILHAMERSDAGGLWPSGWTPFAMNAPSQSRPPVVPVAIGGSTRVVFLGSQDGHVYAVDADTGALVWRSPSQLGDMLQASPAGIFADLGGAPYDHVLIGTRTAAGDNRFYALNAADGTIASQFDNGGGASGMGIVSGGASVDYGSKYVYFASRAKVGGSAHTLWALELTGTGLAYRWSRAVGNVDGSPTLLGDRVYVGANDSKVHAVDAATGADMWLAPFVLGDGPVKGFVWPSWSGNLYLSTTNKVWSLSDVGNAGSKNWEVSLPSPSTPLPAPWLGQLFVGSGDGKLYQIDLVSQAVKSVTLGDGSAQVGPPSFDIANSLLYVGSASGIIYAVAVPLP